MIGGIIPWNDAAGYFVGAQHLLFHSTLNEWNSRRPHNAAFLAFRLAITDLSLKNSVFIMAMLLGIAVFLATELMACAFGVRAGLLFFAFLLGISRWYVASILSESLGLMWGCLGFIGLLRFALEQRKVDMFSGAFFSTLALSARSGAFFALPGIVLFFVFNRSMSARQRLLSVFISLGGIIAAGSISLFLVSAFNGAGTVQGNFYSVLYGISAGGKGWMHVYDKFPSLYNLTEIEQSSFILSKTIENIKENPGHLVYGIASGFVLSILGILLNFLKLLLPFWFIQTINQPYFFWAIILFFPTIGLLYLGSQGGRFLIRSNNPVIAVFLWIFIGIVLSLPIIYPDGRFRVLTSVFPFLALMVALSQATPPTSSLFPSFHRSATFVIGMGTLIPLFLGPLIGAVLLKSPMKAIRKAENSREPFLLLSRETPYIQIASLRAAGDRVSIALDLPEQKILQGSPEKAFLLYPLLFDRDGMHSQPFFLIATSATLPDTWQTFHYATAPLPLSFFQELTIICPVSSTPLGETAQ